MKRIYLLVTLCILFSGFISLKANVVAVKGTVKYANGIVAADQKVTILVVSVSGTSACVQEHTVLTNKDGFYTDQLQCSSDIRKVSISITNCDNQLITEVKEVPASHVVETNFTVCVAAHCVARFISNAALPATAAGFPVKFNSSSSETTSGDVIVERIWKFGEGDPLTGNIVDPTHTYKSPGLYYVCLTTKSSKGCSSTACDTINIKSACKADFSFVQNTLAVTFNSNVSTVLSNDQIIKRTWTFGDGSSNLTGNVVDPTHTYANPGIYTVCLYLKTAGNCESNQCRQITVMPGNENAQVEIISIHPVPVHNEMNAIIWSRNNNVNAELSMYNMNGEKKWSLTITLLEGNNNIKIPSQAIAMLSAGSYFFRVTSMYGIKNKQFYKL